MSLYIVKGIAIQSKKTGSKAGNQGSNAREAYVTPFKSLGIFLLSYRISHKQAWS